jgi:hypothetical protein
LLERHVGIAAIDQTIALDPDEAIPRNNRGDETRLPMGLVKTIQLVV